MRKGLYIPNSDVTELDEQDVLRSVRESLAEKKGPQLIQPDQSAKPASRTTDVNAHSQLELSDSTGGVKAGGAADVSNISPQTTEQGSDSESQTKTTTSSATVSPTPYPPVVENGGPVASAPAGFFIGGANPRGTSPALPHPLPSVSASVEDVPAARTEGVPAGPSDPNGKSAEALPSPKGEKTRRNPDGSTDFFTTETNGITQEKPTSGIPPLSNRASEKNIQGVTTPEELDGKGNTDSSEKANTQKDAFVLFNESEQAVEEIVRQLERFGISLYLSRRDVQAGEKWIERERIELRAARCVLLFLGQQGWGSDHRQLTEESLALGKKIIPALLTRNLTIPAEDVGGIFKQRQYVDLTSNSVKDIRALALQIRSIVSDAGDPRPSTDVGHDLRIVREAGTDQGLLNVNQYADVLSTLIRTIGHGESLSMAILAPWGRGKTYLMRLVSSRLEKSNFTTVNFSAWKYRTTPEVWSFLYETFYREASKSGWAVAVRTWLLRHGLWPAVGLLLAVAALYSKMSQKADLSQFTLPLFGVSGAVFLTESFWRAVKSFKSNYVDLPRHRDRLGLQCAIGDDLRTLLMGWVPEAGGWREQLSAIVSSFRGRPVATLCYLLSAYVVWWIAKEAAVEKAATNSTIGYLVILSLAAVLLLVFLPVWTSVRGVGPQRRALLVVDDLDRCHSGQMLEIIECLQLFLDDDDMKKRLKILMLVEEDILRDAISRKYREVGKGNDDDGDKIADDQVVMDNFEKLFLVWLRLEPLGDDELEQVFEGLCNSLSKVKPTGESAPLQQTVNTASQQQTAQAASQNLRPKSPAQRIDEAENRDNEETLSQEEKAAILAMVKGIRERSGRKSWGPRAVRSFVFRYQLARMLLDRLGIKFDPIDLVEALLAASRSVSVSESQTFDKAVYQIAKQVS